MRRRHSSPANGTGLGLASNATKVLRALGIDLGLGGCGCALEHLELRTARGKMIRALPIQSITAELGDPIVSIHRSDLMRVLLDAAGDTPIRFRAQIVDFETGDQGVRATCADGCDVPADVLIGADGIRSTIRSKIAGAASPIDCGYVFWLATVAFGHPRIVPGYAGHYWGKGQRFGLIDIGGGRVYWWGSKNMPVAQARYWRGHKTEILAAFDGWAPEIIDVIERTPEHTILTVPAQDRPFLEQWGSGPVSLLGDAAHPMQTSLVARRELGGGGRLRAGASHRSSVRSRCGAEAIRGSTPRARSYAGTEFAAVQQAGASAEPCRTCRAGSGGAMRADVGPQAAEHPSDAVRPGMGCGMSPEVRRALSPVERWYWIADQVSPLNVVARVHLRGYIAAGLLERAAGALVAEHPLLRVSIASDADGTNAAFVASSGACPIRRVNGDDLEWERQVDEHELGTSLDWHRGPLVRILDVVLDSSEDAHDLVLTVSHIIADGTTALLLLRRLVERADRLAAAAIVDDLVASRPVVGAPEDLLPARYRGPRGIARLTAIGLAEGLSTALARPRRLMPESPVNPSRRRTRLIRRALSSTQLDAVDTSLPIGGSHCALRARRRDGDGDRAHRGARRFGTNLYRLADRLSRGAGSSGLGRRGRCLRGHSAVDSVFRWRP